VLACLQSIDALEIEVAEALALLEAAVPRSEMVIMIHLMGHLLTSCECLVQSGTAGCTPWSHSLGF
jgi:hypothetical protein